MQQTSSATTTLVMMERLRRWQPTCISRALEQRSASFPTAFSRPAPSQTCSSRYRLDTAAGSAVLVHSYARQL